MGNLRLKPVDPDDPPDGLYPQSQARGIVIYWRSPSPQPVIRRRRQQRQFPLPDWREQLVRFNEVSPGGTDEPPHDAEEQARFVRHVYDAGDGEITRGNTRWTVVPCPGPSDSAQTLPPCASTIPRQR